MQIIDLSHTINNSITVYSETERPAIETSHTHEKDGFAQKYIRMYSHNSTHIDAPFHIVKGTPKLDHMPVETYYGPGVVADCRSCMGKIRKEDLEIYTGELKKSDFLILFTGWEYKWLSPQYKVGYPVLSTKAAEWLLQFGLKGIGLDTQSVDEFESADVPVHNILLGKHLVIIENLTNLEQLLGKNFIFSCLPLKLEEADGSPVRAVGILK